MKKILIVGAGFGQVPAIEKARLLGFEVIAVDKNPAAVGMKMADHSYDVDIVDAQGVLAVAQKHGIHGAMTMQSDLPVPTIGYINDELGLSGVTEEVANNCSNKINTRRMLSVEDCSQPKFAVVKDAEEALKAAQKIGYPCVIKAPDSSGSRGVVKCSEASQVASAVMEAFSYSRGDEILVEEFVPGLEFGAQTFSVNGKCVMTLLHNDTLSDPPYMIPTGHSFPFRTPEGVTEEYLVSEVSKAVDAIGITDGPANVDLILDTQTGEVKVIEIGARIGATCLPELVAYYTGIDWVTQAVLSAVDEEVTLQQIQDQPCAALIVSAPRDGIFESYAQHSAATEEEGLLEFEITVEEGEEVSQLRKGTDRIGKVIMKAATVDEAEALAERYLEKLILNIR